MRCETLKLETFVFSLKISKQIHSCQNLGSL